MAYELNKSDGVKIGDVNDNNTLTKGGLTFFGRNLANYGERLNENFIKILENFARGTAPTDPLEGQLWWDSTNKLLKVRADTSTWKAVGNPAVGPTFVGTPQLGDLWWDSSAGSQQLKLWTGGSWLTIGPEYTSAAGASGLVADTVVDIVSVTHSIVKIYVNSVDVAIIANSSFTLPTATPPAVDVLPGFPRNIIPGINLRGSGELGGFATPSIIMDGTNIRPRTNDITSVGTNALRFSAVYATNFYGDGSNLTNITGSNVTGSVANANSVNGISITENNDNESKYLSYVDATTGSLPVNVSSHLKFVPGTTPASTGTLISPILSTVKLLRTGDTSDNTYISLPEEDTIKIVSNAKEKIITNDAQVTVKGLTVFQSTTNEDILKIEDAGAVKLEKSLKQKVYTIPSSSNPAISAKNGTIQILTLISNTTPSDSLEEGESVTLMIDDGTAFTINWTSMNVRWKTNSGTAPFLNTSQYTVIVLWKVGTIVYGARIGDV